jgi:DNA-directed RNA polymerase subunit RPC12/RpoP
MPRLFHVGEAKTIIDNVDSAVCGACESNVLMHERKNIYNKVRTSSNLTRTVRTSFNAPQAHSTYLRSARYAPSSGLALHPARAL